MKYRKWIVSLVVLGPLCWLLFLILPGGSGILAQLDLGKGKRAMVIQEWSHWAEPYEVGFWFQSSPDELWQWEYLAHEDTRWTRTSLTYENESNSIRIYRGSQLKATFFLDDCIYEIYWGSGAENVTRRELGIAWSSHQPSREWK